MSQEIQASGHLVDALQHLADSDLEGLAARRRDGLGRNAARFAPYEHQPLPFHNKVADDERASRLGLMVVRHVVYGGRLEVERQQSPSPQPRPLKAPRARSWGMREVEFVPSARPSESLVLHPRPLTRSASFSLGASADRTASTSFASSCKRLRIDSRAWYQQS
jgi:hypothetical protein